MILTENGRGFSRQEGIMCIVANHQSSLYSMRVSSRLRYPSSIPIYVMLMFPVPCIPNIVKTTACTVLSVPRRTSRPPRSSGSLGDYPSLSV